MADTKAKFEEFVSTCSGLLKGENPQFLALIKKRYDSCSETFRRSPEMADLLEVTRIKMLTDQKKLFVHLKDFVAELKAWGIKISKIKNDGKRKRKAESPLETVAKMSRMEDSTSEGSDIEGKLQRALGAVFASPLLLSKTASPSCLISGDASMEMSTSGVEKAGSTSAAGDASVPPQEQAVTLNGHTHSPRGETNASALLTVGTPESLKQSDAGSPNQGVSSSSNGSAHGKDSLHVVTDAPEDSTRTVKSNEEKNSSEVTAKTVKTIEEKSFSEESASGTVKSNEEKAYSEVTARTVKSNEEKAYSEDSARTVKSSEPPKCNISVKSSEPNSDMRSLTTPAELENCSDVHSVSDQRKHGTVDVQRRITLTPVQPRCPIVPKNSALISPSSISKSNNSKVFSKPSNSNVTKKGDLSGTVDRLKDRLAASPLPVPPASPPLFEMTCDDTNPNDDDSDVIMIEDDDEEFGEASTVVTMKAAKSGRTETSSMSSFFTTVKPGPSAASSSSTEQALQDGSSPDVAEKASKEQKHVRRLEKLLEKIRDKIEKTCEKDLSIEDLDAEDSPYIFEDCLQKKFIKVWNKLCQVKGRNTSSGRPIERRFKYEGTRFPEINRKIQKFVNRPDCFPDYHDVKGIVKKVNTRCTLGLSAMQINDISREAFLDVGETLKKRRHEDFISTFHSKQTMNFSTDRDPALFDDELRRKLDENGRVGKSRLEEVINRYSNLQTQLAEEGKKDSEGSHDEHSEGSGEGEKGKGQGGSRVKVKETSSERDEEADDSAAAESDSGAMIEMDVAEESDFLHEDDGGEPDHDMSKQQADKSSATDSKASKTNGSDSDSMQPDDENYNKADGDGEQLNDDEEVNSDEQLKDDGQLKKTGKEKDQYSNKSGSRTPQKVSRENHEDARQAADRFNDRSKVGKRVEKCGQRGETGSKPWVSIQNSSIGKEVKDGGSSRYNTSHNGGSEDQSMQNKYSSLHNSRPVSGYVWHRRSPSSKFSFRNKSRSPVKISTSLKLPNFLVRRNGRLLPPKPETVFYPEKSHSFLRGVKDDASVTVICSSDEEDESGRVSVKVEPLVKREPDLCPREDDIIELSDSD
ncbi:hypothetical protein V1264_006129 [Littorina saxatilis]|uniref:Daxx histone-binding domain-containing protein n=2 Tax=Littorina saxatilis TaxID=31220 RepID=A0AAN9G5E2_9CAEN